MPDKTSFLKSALPPPVAALALESVAAEAELLIAMPGDLLPDGRFGESWLLMGRDRLGLVACADGQLPRLLGAHDIATIEDLAVLPGISTATIELTRKGQKYRLLRISNARQRDFSEAVKLIKEWVKEKKWTPEAAEERRNVCPRCRRPLPEDITVCPRCLDKGAMIRKVLGYLRPYRLLVLQLMLCMIATTLVGLVNPYLGKILIDDVIRPLKNEHWLGLLALAMVGLYLTQSLIEMLTGRVSARIGSSAVHDIRGAMFRRLQELSLSFYSKQRTGALITRVNQDTEQLQRLLVDFIPYGISSVLMTVGILALLLYLSAFLTLFVLFPVVGVIVFISLVFPKFRVYWDRFFEKRSKMAAFVSDVITGTRVVKAFAQERAEIDRFAIRNAAYRDSAYQAELKWATAMPILHMIALLGTPIVWFVGGTLAFRGTMTLGGIVAYAGYLAMLFHPVSILTRLAQIIPNTLAAAGRVFDIIDAEPEIVDAADAVPMPQIAGRIEFRNVTFGYDGTKPVLSDVSFTVEPRELIGLVGHSGAGKSTTINLISRFFDVNDGAILIDGVDVRKIRYEDLRRQIGIVLQETFLFNGTIADNIAYARQGATEMEVLRAAKAAHAHEFIIAKPDGYDTEIVEGGSNLSVGEKQRIAIARAILCDPKILILDEATASVDVETEKKIQDALQRLTARCTTIAIAHRLSTLKHADRLMVLEKGKLTETGTHAELVAKDGIYQRLVKIQTELSQLKGVGG